MKYCANKPCKFGGVPYLIGDLIPENVLIPSRIEALKGAGIISEVPDNNVEVQAQVSLVVFKLPIVDENTGESIDTEFTEDELNLVFIILQEQSDKAIKLVDDVKSESVLNAIRALDSRKALKTRAEKVISELYDDKGEA